MSTGRPFVASLKRISSTLTLYTSFHDLINVYSRKSGADNPRGQNFDVNRNLLSLQSFATSFKTRGPRATMLTWGNSYKSLIQHFRLSVVMETNQNEEFVQLLLCLVEDYSTNIYKKFCQNTCSEIPIKTNFHFSHFKPMETLSCHSNERTWAKAIKKHYFCRG